MADETPQLTPPIHQRQYDLDILRFVAATAVVLFHLSCARYGQDRLQFDAPPLFHQLTKYGYLGVQLFFLISGYVIFFSAESKTAAKFLLNRAIRLYPLYWFAVIFATLVFLPQQILPDLTAKSFLANLSMFQAFLYIPNIDSVYWSLAYEMVFYFIIASLLLTHLYRYKMTFLYLWLGWTSIALYSDSFASHMPSLLEYFPTHSPFFISGALFYLARKQGYNYKIIIAQCLSYLLAMFAMYKIETQDIATAHRLPSVLMYTTIFYLTFFLISRHATSLINRPAFEQLGNMTYSLYLMHIPVASLLLFSLGKYLNPWLTLLLTTIACILFAYLAHRYVERPAMNLLRRVLKSDRLKPAQLLQTLRTSSTRYITTAINHLF